MAEPNDNSAPLQWTGVCIDCVDAEEMAAFYGRLLGLEAVARDGVGRSGAAWILMRDPAGGTSLSLQAEEWYEPPVWPEEDGAQSKMLHLEIRVDDVEAAVAHAVAAGATVAAPQPATRSLDELCVMLDPAGHPFCLYRG